MKQPSLTDRAVKVRAYLTDETFGYEHWRAAQFSAPKHDKWGVLLLFETEAARDGALLRADGDCPVHNPALAERGVVPRLLSDDVVSLGKACAVWLTGDPNATADVTNCIAAFQAIEECIRLGQEANHELNRLRLAEEPTP